MSALSLVDVVLQVGKLGRKRALQRGLCGVGEHVVPVSADQQWNHMRHHFLAKPMAGVSRQLARKVVHGHDGDAGRVVHGAF